MFIAHLPAGYLISRACANHYPDKRHLMATGLICSVLPDVDLLWFYLIDNQQTPHHAYLFHWPLFWVAVAGGACLLSWAISRETPQAWMMVAIACLLVHLTLDSLVGGIYWLKPFTDWRLTVVSVPARFEGWMWNFILHWSFAIELIICGLACRTWRRDRQQAGQSDRAVQLLR